MWYIKIRVLVQGLFLNKYYTLVRDIVADKTSYDVPPKKV